MASAAEEHPHKPWSMARVIIASSAGTAFEWYDFFIFGSLTPVISRVFFAQSPRCSHGSYPIRAPALAWALSQSAGLDSGTDS